MEEELSEFLCPVCFEIPANEIYQCQEGHTVCHICVAGLSTCPQCRVPFGTEKIRNRALEHILDKHRFNCSNRDLGCTVKVARRNLQAHSRNCEFRIIEMQLCQSLGYDCDFVVKPTNSLETIKHFENVHKSITKQTHSGTLVLEGWNEVKPNKSIVWTPICFQEVFQDKPVSFICFCKTNGGDQTFSTICVVLGVFRKEAVNHRINVSIASHNEEEPPFNFEASAVSLCDAEETLRQPMLRIPVNLLKANYTTKGCIKLNVSMQRMTVADGTSIITAALNGLTHLHPIYEANDQNLSKLKISEQTELSKNVFDGFSPYYTCDGCSIRPIRGYLYHCLQCANYDLCQACTRKGRHSHHLFVTIKNELQFAALAKAQYDTTLKGSKPLLTADIVVEGPLTCQECKSANPNARNEASHFCRECPKLYGICNSCYRKQRQRHTCTQHTFFPKNVFSS